MSKIDFEEASSGEIVRSIRAELERVYARATDALVADVLGVTPYAVSLWKSDSRRMSRPVRLLAARVVAELRTIASRNDA